MQTQPEKSVLKYIKPAKYSTQMFIPIHIHENQKDFFCIKQYKTSNYIFLASHRIKFDKLISGATYTVDVKSWVHNEYCLVRYKLTILEQPQQKQEDKFLFKLLDKYSSKKG